MTAGHLHNAIHVARLPIQMDRYNGSRPRRDGGLQCIWIHQHRVFFNLNEDRPSSCKGDGLGGSDESVRYRNDLITRSNTQTTQSEIESICAVADADAGFGLTVACELSLKCLEFFATNEGAVNNCTRDRCIDIGFNREILRVQIAKRNVHQ